MSDPAEALRAWRGFFAGCRTTIEMDPVVAAYVADALTTAIDAIEAAKELGRFMAFLADTDSGQLCVGQADAVATGVTTGQVVVLAQVRLLRSLQATGGVA